MFPFNFTYLKKTTCLMTCLFLFACSSTEQVHNSQFSAEGYANGHVKSNYNHSHFTPVNGNTIKKPLSSDHQLMMSLLNRPITADQAMMLAFAKERQSYTTPYSNYAVEIKGAKETERESIRAVHAYAAVISQDINAVTISAPQ